MGAVGAVGAVRAEGVWAHIGSLLLKHLQGRPGWWGRWGGGVGAVAPLTIGVVFGGLLLCGSSAFRSVVFSSLITRVFYCDGPSRGDSRLLRVPDSVIAFLHIKGLLIETPGNQPPFGE